MAEAGLFIGWGEVVRGREMQSTRVYNETIQYFAQLQQRGEIESFEPVALEPHGGDLQGFVLLRGDREKLNRVRSSDEFWRLMARAGFIINSLGVVGADIGEAVQRLYEGYAEINADLA
jgi:hypothetical protein